MGRKTVALPTYFKCGSKKNPAEHRQAEHRRRHAQSAAYSANVAVPLESRAKARKRPRICPENPAVSGHGRPFDVGGRQNSSVFLSEEVRHRVAACYCLSEGFSRPRIRRFLDTVNMIYSGYSELKFCLLLKLMKEQLSAFRYQERFFCQICNTELAKFTSPCPNNCKPTKRLHTGNKATLLPMTVGTCSVRSQLERVLSLYFREIWRNLDRMNLPEMSELVTFPAYRKSLKFGENPSLRADGKKILEVSLIFSIDGVDFTQRSRTKAWLSCGQVIELPKHLREREDCALIFIASSSSCNPTLDSQNIYLDDFVEEMKHLRKKPFPVLMGGEVVEVHVVMKLCCADLPARNQLLLHRSFQAAQGCLLCTQKCVSAGSRKIWQPCEDVELRTADSHFAAAERAEKARKENPSLDVAATCVDGVAGQSKILELVSVTSCIVDWFHLAAEGLGKMFRTRCFGESLRSATGVNMDWNMRKNFVKITQLLRETQFPPTFPRSLDHMEFAKWTGSASLDFFCFMLLPLIAFFPPADPDCFFALSLVVSAFLLPRLDSFSEDVFKEYDEIIETLRQSYEALDVADLTINFHQLVQHTSVYFRNVGSLADLSSSSMEKNYGFWKNLVSKNISRNQAGSLARSLVQLKGLQLSLLQSEEMHSNRRLQNFVSSLGALRKFAESGEALMSVQDTALLSEMELEAFGCAGISVESCKFFCRLSVGNLMYTVRSEKPNCRRCRCLTVFEDDAGEVQFGMICRIFGHSTNDEFYPLVLVLLFDKTHSLADWVAPPNNEKLRTYFSLPRRSFFYVGQWSANFAFVDPSRLRGFAMQISVSGSVVMVNCSSRYLTT